MPRWKLFLLSLLLCIFWMMFWMVAIVGAVNGPIIVDGTIDRVESGIAMVEVQAGTELAEGKHVKVVILPWTN